MYNQQTEIYTELNELKTNLNAIYKQYKQFGMGSEELYYEGEYIPCSYYNVYAKIVALQEICDEGGEEAQDAAAQEEEDYQIRLAEWNAFLDSA